jgi:hypothetical protein
VTKIPENLGKKIVAEARARQEVLRQARVKQVHLTAQYFGRKGDIVKYYKVLERLESEANRTCKP